MKPLKSALVVVSAAVAFAAIAPAAHADPATGPSGNVAGACGTSSGNEDQGGTAGSGNQVCMTSGVVYIGAQNGQVANLVGPNIAGGAAVGGPVIVAAGDVAVNNGPVL
jgi:hypothetical protein